MSTHLKLWTTSDSIIKGDHSRKLKFLSSSLASKQSAFPLTEVSASEVPDILKNFVLKDRLSFGNRPFEIVLVARPFTWRHLVRPEKQGEKTCNWLSILHKDSKIWGFFFQAIFHFDISNAIISEFGACLAQNNIGSRAAITQNGSRLKASSDAISRTELRHKTVANCWVLFKMVATMFEIWASLETNNTRKTCTLKAGSG